MIKSTVYLTGTALLLLFLCGLLASGSYSRPAGDNGTLRAKRQLVKELGLTDLSLCSEARYTRHPSQADLFSAFQDFPGAFEHFPTGSIIVPNPIGFFSHVEIHHQPEHK